MRAGIAFGSNLGDRLAQLRQARACILASPLLAPPILTSSLYLTSPVDCPPGSDSFLNGILEAELTGTPMDLLRELLALEQGLGRTAGAGLHAPRIIDLDLLYAGDCEIRNDSLTLPHPGITRRRFVLAPLADLAPDLVTSDQLRSSGGEVVAVGSL